MDYSQRLRFVSNCSFFVQQLQPHFLQTQSNSCRTVRHTWVLRGSAVCFSTLWPSRFPSSGNLVEPQQKVSNLNPTRLTDAVGLL